MNANGAALDLKNLMKLPETFQHVLSLRLWTLNKSAFSRACSFHKHKHVYFEVIIPLRGNYRCLLNGEEAKASPRECVFIEPGDSHEDFYEAGLEFVALLFYFHDLSASRWNGHVLRESLPANERTLKLEEGSRASRVAEIISEAPPAEACDPLAVLSLEALSEAFFWSIAKTIPAAAFSGEFLKSLGEDEFRLKCLTFFSSNGERGALNLDEMASSMGISRRALSYKFNNVFGTSPAKAHTSWRIGKAAALIEGGSSAKDAAQALGFSDQFHFSKVFKREMGFPPSKLGLKTR